MKSKTPKEVRLEKESFIWNEGGIKHEKRFEQVIEVERVNDNLYIVHYVEKDKTKKLFVYWPIAEEIEERAGIYPRGRRGLKEKLSSEQEEKS